MDLSRHRLGRCWLVLRCSLTVLSLFLFPLSTLLNSQECTGAFLLPSIVPCCSFMDTNTMPGHKRLRSQQSHEKTLACFAHGYLSDARIHYSPFSRCLTHSCSTLWVWQILKIFFLQQIDVMKQLIHIMVGLLPVSVWWVIMSVLVRPVLPLLEKPLSHVSYDVTLCNHSYV